MAQSMAKTVAASILFLALLCGVPVSAQEGLVRVTTVRVQLGHQKHFESLIPKITEALKKLGDKHQYFVSAGVSEPGAYVFVTPIKDFADLGAQQKALMDAFASIPEVGAELDGITTSVDDEIWLDRPDLGYVPANQRVAPEAQMYTRVAILHAVPSQAMALEAVLKERAALRKKHGLTDAIGVAQLLIGADGPAYAVILGAKDEVDFYTQLNKDAQKMGAEWQASLDKAGPMVRSIEFATSTSRPALDYRP
jgi:hypothetical protein